MQLVCLWSVCKALLLLGNPPSQARQAEPAPLMYCITRDEK